MPNKDPALWSLVLVWLSDNWPTLYGTILATVIAWLRVTYDGGKGRRRCLEASLIGVITFAFISGFSWFGIPPQASGPVGGIVGLFGVDKVREIAARILGEKFGA